MHEVTPEYTWMHRHWPMELFFLHLWLKDVFRPWCQVTLAAFLFARFTDSSATLSCLPTRWWWYTYMRQFVILLAITKTKTKMVFITNMSLVCAVRTSTSGWWSSAWTSPVSWWTCVAARRRSRPYSARDASRAGHVTHSPGSRWPSSTKRRRLPSSFELDCFLCCTQLSGLFVLSWWVNDILTMRTSIIIIN